MDIILNPIVISVAVMIVLCLLKVNVYMTIMFSALVCSVVSGAGMTAGMNAFISGMGNNSEIVNNMLLFGALGYAMEKADVGAVLVPRVSKLIGNKVWLLPVALCVMGAISETFILIYVSFVPIFIPPLLGLFNKYKVDRRMLVTAIMCGLQIGYVCTPAGFGLMFQEIVRGELATNGLEVAIGEIWRANLPILLALVIGLVLAIVAFRKPREYKETVPVNTQPGELPKIEFRHIACIASAIVAVIVKMVTDSMPLGAFFTIVTLLVSGAVKLNKLEETIQGGVTSMGYVAFSLMAATGFANVCRELGDVDGLVSAMAGVTGGSKPIGAAVMLLLGLLVTIGIGSAWSTIPIVAAVLVPLGLQMGFSPAAIILLVSASAALGDSGSPASDQTLVPTAAFNVDGQHDHIWDTCVPSFICVNVPLLVVCAVAACMM